MFVSSFKLVLCSPLALMCFGLNLVLFGCASVCLSLFGDACSSLLYVVFALTCYVLVWLRVCLFVFAVVGCCLFYF